MINCILSNYAEYIRGNCDRCQIYSVDYDVWERQKYLANVSLFARLAYTGSYVGGHPQYGHKKYVHKQ